MKRIDVDYITAHTKITPNKFSVIVYKDVEFKIGRPKHRPKKTCYTVITYLI